MKAFIALVAAAGLAACASSAAAPARSGFLHVDGVFLGKVMSFRKGLMIVTNMQMPLGVESRIITFEVLGRPDTVTSVYDSYDRCDVSDTYEGAQLVFAAPVRGDAPTDDWLEVYACIKVDPDTVRHFMLHERPLAQTPY